jgi:hypothetical protein
MTALAPGSLSADLREFLALLFKHEVRFLIVGGEAVVFHGHARFTGDVDFFFEPTPNNASRLHAALLEFWHGSVPGVACAEELLEPGVIFQFGRPPNRMDLMGQIDGVDFDAAHATRVLAELPEVGVVPFIGLDALLANKRASGRPKDLADIAALQIQPSPGSRVN